MGLNILTRDISPDMFNDIYKNKKVLVTGAGGFIGSHLVEALLEKEATVRAFVRYNGRGDWGMLSDLSADALRSIEVISGDIRDPFFD